MSRLTIILASVIVAAVAVLAFRTTERLQRPPWYVSQIESLEFSPVETNWNQQPPRPPERAKLPQLNEGLPIARREAPAPVIQRLPALDTSEVDESSMKLDPMAKVPVTPFPAIEEPPFPSVIATAPPRTRTIDVTPPIIEETFSPDVFPFPPLNEEPPLPDPPQVVEPAIDREPPKGDSTPPQDFAGDPVNEEPPFVAPTIEEPPFVAPVEPAVDERDVVLHAAGAVMLRAPLGWKTVEVPFGREIRLVLLPPGESPRADMPGDGVWLSYHVRPYPMTPKQEEITSMLDSRLKAASPGSQADPNVVADRVSDLPTVSKAFLNRGKANTKRIGFHMLVGAEHGVIEIHGVSPLKLSAERETVWTDLINSIEINEPEEEKIDLQPPAMDAKRVIGNWKAMRSVMQFKADGTVIITSDPKRGSLLDGSDQQEPIEQVTGKFQAKDDLIMVMWKDGSRLNYRWKRDGIRLLLTDSDGRISQLRRFYD